MRGHGFWCTHVIDTIDDRIDTTVTHGQPVSTEEYDINIPIPKRPLVDIPSYVGLLVAYSLMLGRTSFSTKYVSYGSQQNVKTATTTDSILTT